MSVRVRFAPSPTGYLHVGGARTALYNYLFARANGGVFVLRIEDTDTARSTEDSLAAILDGMRWLGLHWDEGPGVGGAHGPYAQSQRRGRYDAHARALETAGRAYPCYCTPEELEERRARRAAAGDGSGYDGHCRDLPASERDARERAGRSRALRFASPGSGEVAWDDMVRGRVAFPGEVLEDFVLMRSDGLPTYNFACVVDDHEMAISHVIRGDDHISNTPRQLLLYDALGFAPPVFAHVPMILGADGSRLSKRHGATSVASYREMGMLPEAMVNFLALLGWSYDGQRELFTLAELERVFRLERVGANASVFDVQKLEWVNAQHLKRLPEDERVRRVEEFLLTRGWDLSTRDPEWRVAFVRALGDRLRTLRDAEEYGRFALDDTLEIEPTAWQELLGRPDVSGRLRALADQIESDPDYTPESLERGLRALAGERGVKAGELIGPARVALAGRTVSPGIFDVMLLLGRERTLERLREAAARWERETTAGTTRR
ncbi:MAG: glutamate--tRNA ligase [Candidatus Eisenbacteria bacterium]